MDNSGFLMVSPGLQVAVLAAHFEEIVPRPRSTFGASQYLAAPGHR